MSNVDQAEFWSGDAGRKWVEHQDAMDHLLAPVLEALMARANIKNGEQVIDIGCGTGASVAAAAQRTTPTGRVVGVDISQTLLDLARARLQTRSNTTLIHADAAHTALPGPFDVMISRFGVMFFADAAAAFRNIARAVKTGGRFVMAAWGDARQNPYFMEAAAAAREVLGDLPKVDRTLPGPFAFEDPDRVTSLLHGAGLSEISVEPVSLDLTPKGTASNMADLWMQICPAQSAMNKMDAAPDAREAIKASLQTKAAAFATPTGLRIPARINLITARNPL